MIPTGFVMLLMFIANMFGLYADGFGEPVSLDSLGLYLSSYDTGDVDKKEFPVTLQADSNVTHGTIVKLLDIARENGYSIVNLRTATEE